MSEGSIQPRDGSSPEKLEKLIHLALPVRLTHMKNGERGVLEMACTYDIHPRGARLLSARDVRVGDMVTIERGRNKSVCQVVWTADPNSALRGQFTVQSLDGGRVPWEEELRQAEEQFLPVTAEISGKPVSKAFRSAGQNRRRQQRFSVEGFAELADISGKARVAGRLAQISESGCLINATDLPLPGTDLRLRLNIYDVSVALKGQVKYKADKLGMGVEFQEIRHGDRPLLNYVLSQLGKRPGGDEFAGLEVVTEPLAAESE